MRSFLIEAARAIGTTWSRTWRWAFHRPLNLVVTIAGILVLIAVVAVVLRPATVARPPAANPTPTVTETPVPMVEVTATPLEPAVSSGSIEPTPDPTATEATSEPTATADPGVAEALARTWAEAYFARSAPDDDAWVAAIEDFTTPELVSELSRLAFLEGTPLADAATPTTIESIAVEPRSSSAEANTPIRWSQTLVVTVSDSTGTTTVLDYSVVLYDSDQGWMLTSVRLLDIE